ncbi:hypothetical protein CLV54_0205 [Compostimonas suwonensis]|uniref:Uncharacterized protein n=2 Tax=Compostimonas suwonensis TaxID=1048394 RepID=A0A2M9C3S2_9MICO|nr:hypothetical protein CLV54_0205 [Compostimonas suwonensis]
MTITAAATGNYSSGVGRRLGSLLGFLLITAILSIVIPKFFIGEILRVRDQRTLVVICFAILTIGVVWAIVRVFVTGPVRIVTTPTEVTVYRAGRSRDRWTRSEARFSSFVIRESTNGVRTASTRKLIVTTKTERVEIVCTWFSPATFNALLADVSPVTGAAGAVGAVGLAGVAAPVGPAVTPGIVGATPYGGGAPEGWAPGASAAGVTGSAGAAGAESRVDAASRRAPAASGDFVLDHTPLRRSRTALSIVLVVGVLIAIAVGVFALMDGETDVLVIVGALVLAAVIVGLIGLFSQRGRGRVPSRIAVTPSSIQVDGRMFLVHQLSSVVATPPSYTTGQRALLLVESSGARTRVPLGRNVAPGARGDVFPAYPLFVETLAAATSHRPGLLTFDLG